MTTFPAVLFVRPAALPRPYHSCYSLHPPSVETSQPALARKTTLALAKVSSRRQYFGVFSRNLGAWRGLERHCSKPNPCHLVELLPSRVKAATRMHPGEEPFLTPPPWSSTDALLMAMPRFAVSVAPLAEEQEALHLLHDKRRAVKGNG